MPEKGTQNLKLSSKIPTDTVGTTQGSRDVNVGQIVSKTMKWFMPVNGKFLEEQFISNYRKLLIARCSKQ